MDAGRLLVLDDDETVGQILCLGAQASGFESRLCLTLEACLQAIAAWAPTHLSVDLTMPGHGSSEVLRALAAAGCRAQVIVCSGAGPTALARALDEARALGLPVAGALEKPFPLARLRALLAGTAA